MDKTRFIHEVADRLRCDKERAEAVTFAVFQELRQRITQKEASDVAAQLPAGLKAMWLENEEQNRGVVRMHEHEFVGRVRKLAALSDDTEAERGVKVVFGVLQQALGSPTGKEGEAWDVFSQLPKDLKLLWLSAHQGP